MLCNVHPLKYLLNIFIYFHCKIYLLVNFATKDFREVLIIGVSNYFHGTYCFSKAVKIN